MCLRAQGIYDDNGVVDRLRPARGLSDDNGGVGRGQGIDDTPKGLETIIEALRIQGQ